MSGNSINFESFLNYTIWPSTVDKFKEHTTNALPNFQWEWINRQWTNLNMRLDFKVKILFEEMSTRTGAYTVISKKMLSKTLLLILFSHYRVANIFTFET